MPQFRDAGTLRRRITIQRVTETQDDQGQVVETWATLATRWASIEPLQGREFFASQQLDESLDVRFRIRYDSTVGTMTTKDRISWNSRTFDIRSISNLEQRNIEMEILAQERT